MCKRWAALETSATAGTQTGIYIYPRFTPGFFQFVHDVHGETGRH